MQYGVFRYLAATEHAETYRRIMLQFMAAKERFTVHQRPEEIQDALGESRDLTDALAQLVVWGNLRADPDTSRVTTVEEFNRARYIYQLTAEGESAERALAEFDRTFGATGALQSWALDDIVEQLRVLLALAAADELDEPKAAVALTTLTDRFTGLAANAQAFSGHLQRTIDLRGIDTEAFIAYKERLIGYLQRFIQDLVSRTAEIAGLLDQLPPATIERLLEAVALREARDAAPDADATADAIAPIRVLWRERFAGFRHWFVGGAGGPSQSQQLRHMAVNAIPELLSVVQRLGDRRAGRSDRTADYRTLAFWFAEAPTDDERHRLAAVAFGLAPARHLAIQHDTLESRDREPVAPSTPWRDAPAVEISPRLRATGSYERRGQPSRVRDRAAERRAIAHSVEVARIATERLRDQLLTEAQVPVGDFPITDPDARAFLLQLLGDALSQRRTPAEPVEVTSIDGTYRIEVTPGLDASTTLRLVDGWLTGPAHRVRVRETERADTERAHTVRAQTPARVDS